MTDLVCTTCDVPLKPSPKRKGTCCRSCSTRATGRNPASRALAAASMRARFEDPAYYALHVTRTTKGTRLSLLQPEARERRAELGRRVAALRLGMVQHGPGSPKRVAAGRKRSATVLAWCPIEYRAHYAHLKITKLLRAPEARRLIEEMIAVDLARYRKTGKLQQAARA